MIRSSRNLWSNERSTPTKKKRTGRRRALPRKTQLRWTKKIKTQSKIWNTEKTFETMASASPPQYVPAPTYPLLQLSFLPSAKTH